MEKVIFRQQKVPGTDIYRFYVGRKAVTHWIRAGISSGQINENNIKKSEMVRNLLEAQRFKSDTYFSTISSFDITYKHRYSKQLHREDGPAVITIDGEKQWWKNGSLHRIDGPAIVKPKNYPTASNDIYINGKAVTKEYNDWLVEADININRLDDADRALLRIKWENYGE